MKAYWIAKVNVDDNEAYAEYAKRVTPALAKYNGKFLVRGGKFEILEGKNEYERNVVVEFLQLILLENFIIQKSIKKLNLLEMEKQTLMLLLLRASILNRLRVYTSPQIPSCN